MALAAGTKVGQYEILAPFGAGPRRSAKVIHFCSLKLTHTKNTICRRARDRSSDIIRVRGNLPSSAPEGSVTHSVSGNEPPAPTKRSSVGERQPWLARDLLRGKNALLLAAKATSSRRGGGSLLASKVWKFLASAEGLAQELFGRFHITLPAQIEVDRESLLVDRSIQVDPCAPNLYICL